MSGRVDSATHAAAIAKINAASKYSAELREHLTEVLAGPAFKGSQRSQEFLRFIVEKALRGEFDDLRERTIGIELFGRPAAYDTAEDAVVRVTASDVRKRLLQHYGMAKAPSNFRIDLPSGAYMPEFRCISPNATSAVANLLTADEEVGKAPGEPAVTTSPSLVVHWWWVPTLAAVLALAGALSWFFLRHASSPVSTSNLISAGFQSSPGSMQVIVGDDGLLLIEVLLDHRFTLQEYENLKYLSTPDLIQKKGLQQFWQSLSTRQITNLGNLQNATHVAETMRSRNWNVVIRHARQVNARDFRSGNFIILGSSHSNPWADLFQVHDSNFQFESVPLGQSAGILNRHPLPGEPSTFEVHVDPRTGKTLTYALVSLVDNNSHNGRVFLVAGQSTSATELAGEFLLRSDSVPKILRSINLPSKSALPDLEMVLSVTEVNEIGDSVGLVSCRKLTARSD